VLFWEISIFPRKFFHFISIKFTDIMSRILVFTATYNEVDNIENLIGEIFHYLPKAEILVVDDASPDGTGDLLDRLAGRNDRIHVLHRPSKLGLGSAHLLAMKFALHKEYDYLVTMDADFSHHPRYLPTLIDLQEQNEFVIGSRYIEGGKCDYGFVRTLISKTANGLARHLLGIPTHEATTSYRCFSRKLLQEMDIDSIWSDGYSFFMESLFVVKRSTDKLGEFPIHFEDRRAGTSKISKREIFKAIYNISRLFYNRLFVLPFGKRQIRKNNNDFQMVCENCYSIYKTELFPAKVADKVDASAYQCTSTGHQSHGRILKCLNCGLVYNESRHPPEEILNMYSEVKDETYLENLDSRFQTFRHNFKKVRRYLPSSGRLLDIGSYCGVSLKVARELGFEPLGVEPSKWAVQYCRDNLDENIIQGTLKDLPSEADSFDVITMWDVLEHMTHPIDELVEVKSRLKPDGVFVFSTLYLNSWYPKILKDRWPWYMDMHLFYFTLDSLSQMLKKTGFELVHFEKYTHIITLEYLFVKLEALGVPGAGWMKRLIGRTFLKRWMIPFSFGDVQMFICQKSHKIDPETTVKLDAGEPVLINH